MSHRPARTNDGVAGPILAAGAICWRFAGDNGESGDDGRDPGSGDDLELLLVRSARWGDWSWPKGKLDPHESLPECAVREVAEETGARIELGQPLPSVNYVMPDGRAKRVTYWAARVRQSGPRLALDDEIAAVEWLPAAAAVQRLTRPSDLRPVTELLSLAEQGRLDTRALLVLRHAKARSRSQWSGREPDRPLTSAGRRQARGLAGLLACWQPERLLTSPWERCIRTLQPYLDQPNPNQSNPNRPDPNRSDPNRSGGGRAEPEVLALLSERGFRDDPDAVRDLVEGLLSRSPGSALICTHRPVLAAIVETLSDAATGPAAQSLPEADPWLTPAEVLVAHVHSGFEPNVISRIQRVERHRGESPRNTPH